MHMHNVTVDHEIRAKLQDQRAHTPLFSNSTHDQSIAFVKVKHAQHEISQLQERV